MTLVIDLQRTHALGICCDCDGPCIVTEHGRCETCGSSSVIRAFSLAATIARERLVLDPKFLRGARWAGSASVINVRAGGDETVRA